MNSPVCSNDLSSPVLTKKFTKALCALALSHHTFISSSYRNAS